MKKRFTKITVTGIICLFIIAIIGVTVALAIGNDSGGETSKSYSYADIVERMYNPKLLAYKTTGEESKQFSSYDRASMIDENGNYHGWNGNADRDGVLRRDKDGGYVIAEMNGPGYISRIWSALGEDGRVKIYVDDKETPVIDCDMIDIFRGTGHPSFAFENLSYDASQGDNTYVPITYNSYCKVVVSELGIDDGGYYIVNYVQLPEGSRVESFGSELTEEQRAALEKADKFFDERLGTNPLGTADAEAESVTVTKNQPFVFEKEGKGAIIGMTFRLKNAGSNNSVDVIKSLKNLQLRAYWNGEQQPSVSAPLGDFVGSGYGITDVKTVVAGVRDDGTLYSYYYMPYTLGARIEIVNLGDRAIELDVSITTGALDEKATDYKFCAVWNRGEYYVDENGVSADPSGNHPNSRKPDYGFLKVKGSGKLVGVNLHHYKWINGKSPTCSPGSPWWGEGDEKFFVDGEVFPSWFGTGTEDFFGYAWCDPNVFSKPFHAQSYCVGGSNNMGNRVLTRIFMGEAIPFESEIDCYIEKYYDDDYIKYAFTTTFYASFDAEIDRPEYEASEYHDYFDYDEGAKPGQLIEAEEMRVVSNDADVVIQSGTAESPSMRLSGGKNVWWNTKANDEAAIGKSLTVWSPVGEEDGEYVILASILRASDFGRYKITVGNTVLQSDFDFYGSSLSIDELVELGRANLVSGYANKLTFECIGKSEQSRGYHMGLDFLLAVPVSEYTALNEFSLLKYTDVTRSAAKDEGTVLKYEAEKISWGNTNGNGIPHQEMQSFGSGWSGDKQIMWLGDDNGSELFTTNLSSPKSGLYTLKLGVTTAGDYGKMEVYFNGKSVGNHDCYSSGVNREELTFNGCAVNSGENTLVIQCVGKNAKSTSYLFGIDCITLYEVGSRAPCDFYEIEKQTYLVTGGNHTIQNDLAWLLNGNAQVWWRTPSVGDVMTVTVNCDKSVIGRMYGDFVIAGDYGRFRIEVNGVTVIENCDFYSPILSRKTVDFGVVTLNKGANTVKFYCLDKNPASSGNMLGFDRLIIYKN